MYGALRDVRIVNQACRATVSTERHAMARTGAPVILKPFSHVLYTLLPHDCTNCDAITPLR